MTRSCVVYTPLTMLSCLALVPSTKISDRGDAIVSLRGFVGAGRLGCHVEVSVPKGEESFTYEGDAVLGVRIATAKTGEVATLKVISLAASKQN